MFLSFINIKLYDKKILKNETSIVKEKIISLILVFSMPSRLSVGKNPPDDIKVNARLKEIKDLIFTK